LLRATKPMRLYELAKVKCQMASVGGAETLIKAYIAKEIDKAYEEFNKFYGKWKEVYSQLSSRLKEYKNLVKYLGLVG